MKIKVRNLEVILGAVSEGVSYFLGEYKSTTNPTEKVIIFFSIPSKLDNISTKTINEITLLEAKNLSNTYIETNICINGHYAPFQQHFIRLDKFDWIIPIPKYPKNGLQLLLSADQNKSITDYLDILKKEFDKQNIEK